MSSPNASPRPGLTGRKSGRVSNGILLLVLLAIACPQVPTDAYCQDADAAWMLLVRDRPDEAADVAGRALEEDRDDARAAACLASALCELEREQEARNLFAGLENERRSSGIGPLGLGAVAFHDGDFAAADSLFRLSLTRFDAAGDSRGEMVASERLGTTLRNLRRREESATVLEAAVALADSLQSAATAAYARLELAYTILYTDRERAERELKRVIDESRAVGQPAWRGRAEIALSSLATLRMDTEAGMRHSMAAFEAYEEAGDLPGQARSLRFAAAKHLYLGELTAALPKFLQARDLAVQGQDLREAAECLSNIGSLYNYLGDYERAVIEFEEALRLGGEKLPRHRLGGLLSNIGIVLAAMGRHEEALDYYERAVVEVRRHAESSRQTNVLLALSNVLTNYGDCLCDVGDHGSGIDRIEEAIAVSREGGIPLEEAYALQAVAMCRLIAGDPARAETDLLAARELVTGAAYYHVEESIYLGQAMTARDQGRLDTAWARLAEAMDLVESVRARAALSTSVRQGVFGFAISIYQEAVDLLGEMHDRDPDGGFDRTAFEVAQRAKGRLFSDLLVEIGVDLRSRAAPDYQAREQEMLRLISELTQAGPSSENAATVDAEIANLERQLDVLEIELRQADPGYAEIRFPRPPGLRQVQEKVLDDGELLLDFFLGDDASYMWAVTRDAFRLIRLPARSEIEDGVGALLSVLRDYNITGPDPTYFIEAARDVSSMLIAPVADDLEQASRLIVSPDGILHYLPFEVLLTDPVEGTGRRRLDSDFATLPYLVRQNDVIYAPSVGVVDLLRTRRTTALESSEGLLLVGDPTVNREREPDLFMRVAMGDVSQPVPFASEEIEAIRAQFPEPQCRVLSGSEATLTAVRSAVDTKPYGFVHFATHGVFNERRPAFSGLILSADGADDDGFMSVGEVFGLELPSDLVVLSACSSGLGEHVKGEGLVGLARAFIYAGASNVVATLWQVSGRETSMLMTSFYDGLRRGDRRDPARALAEAKRGMIAGGDAEAGTERSIRRGGDVVLAHPFFWSAFILTGGN